MEFAMMHGNWPRYNPRAVCIAIVVVTLLRAAIPSPAQTGADVSRDQSSFSNDTWHVSVSPYLWMAGMNGSVGFRQYQVQVNQSFSDIFENLKFGVMGLTEVRRGQIGFLTDLMYIHLGNESAIPISGLPNALNVSTSLNTFTLTPYFGYRFFARKRGSIDVIAGGRYYHVGASISASTGGPRNLSVSASNDWADLVEGGRFTLNITPRVRTFFIGDVGALGSVMTWQIVGGVGLKWSKRWSTELGYRRLYFNRQTNNGFGLEETQEGLIVGATFRMR
jgi:hypothetical protein